MQVNGQADGTVDQLRRIHQLETGLQKAINKLKVAPELRIREREQAIAELEATLRSRIHIVGRA